LFRNYKSYGILLFTMLSHLQHQYVVERLKIVHLSGITVMMVFFLLMFFLERFADVHTLTTQFILLFMAVVLALSYGSLLFRTNKIPVLPLLFFYILNILTSILVWATGSIESPFSMLYIILIIITSQLYHYRHGILQTLLAFAGFVFVYSATSYNLLAPHSIIPDENIIVYNHTATVFVYGILYAAIFLFTLFSSSSARVVLFREHNRKDMDSTFQEKIIETMPIGVLIVDGELNILGGNPTANINFPTQPSSNKLVNYLSLPKLNPKSSLTSLGKSGEERQLTWKLDTGEIRPVTISVQIHKSSKKSDTSFILFLREP